MANFGPNIVRIHDRESLVAGTYRQAVKVGGWSDVGIQWIQFAAVGAATITVYSTTDTDKRVLDNLDPSTNPLWRDETGSGAVFNTSPSAAIGTDSITLSDNPYYYLMIEVVVSVDLDDFSLHVRAQGRSGS